MKTTSLLPPSIRLSALLLALLGPALPRSAAGENEDARLVLDYQATSAGPVAMRDSLASFRPALELRALKDDSNVSLRWGTPLKDENRFIAFTASVPLNENGPTTDLATLDGLAKATTLEAKFNWFFGTPPAAPSAPATRQAGPLDPRTEYLRTRLANTLASDNSRSPGGDMQLGESSDRAIEQIASRTTVISGSGTIGYKSFDYLEEATLADKSSSKTVYGGRLSLAKYVWDNSAMLAEFEYQDSFADADTKSFALPPDANGRQEVKSGPLGSPNRSVKRLYSVEFRRRLKILGADNGGIAVKLTYDQVADVFGVRVPVYFIQDDKSNVTGGIELRWTDHKGDTPAKFTIAVVIGAGLKLTPF